MKKILMMIALVSGMTCFGASQTIQGKTVRFNPATKHIEIVEGDRPVAALPVKSAQEGEEKVKDLGRWLTLQGKVEAGKADELTEAEEAEYWQLQKKHGLFL